jgi:hypothetical protein
MIENLSPAWIFKHSCPCTDVIHTERFGKDVPNLEALKPLFSARSSFGVELNNGAASRSFEAAQEYLPYAKAMVCWRIRLFLLLFFLHFVVCLAIYFVIFQQKELLSASEKGFSNIGVLFVLFCFVLSLVSLVAPGIVWYSPFTAAFVAKAFTLTNVQQEVIMVMLVWEGKGNEAEK